MNFTMNQKPDVMKRTFAYIVITGLLLMSSCLVSSLHPFYKAKDKIYDPAMVATFGLSYYAIGRSNLHLIET